ncbi:DUF7948 domain-containing protein [Hyalangium gracile]
MTASGSSAVQSPPAPPGPARPASSKQAFIAPEPGSPGRYLLEQPGARALFNESGVTMRLTAPERPARELRWGLAGARAVMPQPLQPREARLHQLVGQKESWRQDLPTWAALYYPGVAPGVDLWMEARDEGVAYSLRAEHGADLRQVRLEWRGAQALRVADGGRALEVELADGTLREEGLRCGQEGAAGKSLELPCRYREARLKGPDLWEYVIEVDVKEPRAPAWVDPVIRWNTFVGLGGNDSLNGITILEPGGWVFSVGASGSGTGPAVPSAGTGLDQRGSNSDVVVSRNDGTGTLIWRAVFGGSGNDVAKVFVIGENSFVYVAGTTGSLDFPLAPGSMAANGATDGFIARMASNGSGFSWVRRVGGPGDEDIHSLVLGQDKKLYAVGSSTSSRMPGWDGGVSLGQRDFFVSRLDAISGDLERTLVLSGSGHEEALSIARDPQATSGAILYVTGYTESANFPLSGAVVGPADLDGGREAVVLRLNQDLVTPTWWTFLGGHGQDQGNAILYQGSPSRVIVVGTTGSSDFPLPNAPTGNPFGVNAFAAGFNPSTGQRTFALATGGAGDDEGFAVAAGTFDTFYIGGRTTSRDLPTSLGFDKESSGTTEGFVLRMAPDAGSFFPEWGTYVGGALQDEVRALASGEGNELLIGGATRSGDMLDNLSPVGEDLSYSFQDDMFLISLEATDLTPPVGQVNDGTSGDVDTQETNLALTAHWLFTDHETGLRDYEFGAGTVPGCTDTVPFRLMNRALSISLDSTQPGFRPLVPGTWYFATVRATNNEGLTTTLSSDGFFVLSDGGPAVLPPKPLPGTPCPGGQPDGGALDGGLPDGGLPDGGGLLPDGGSPPGPDEEDGARSPLGWGCGATGGPTAVVLLMLVALGLWGSRRRAR